MLGSRAGESGVAWMTQPSDSCQDEPPPTNRRKVQDLSRVGRRSGGGGDAAFHHPRTPSLSPHDQMRPSTLLAAAGLLACTRAAPSSASSPAQIVLGPEPASFESGHAAWDPLDYSSGISPYHDAPGANIRAPKGCNVTAAAFLMRHSSIFANDDEWYDYMEPFVTRVAVARGDFPANSPLAFLNDWECPINVDNLEQLTGPGEDDAHTMGKRFRYLYPDLFPPRYLGAKHAEDEQVKTPFQIWSASSSRDVSTAKAFVRGAFPRRQEGDDGEGDGKYLRLVQVPNNNTDWSASLTPHKVCPRFSKEEGRADARVFLENWGMGPLKKLQAMAPDFEFVLDDVIAIMMLCGYESVIKGRGKTDFCRASIFDTEDYRNYEYFFDLLYHKMVGYASPVAPYLGVHWLNTSTHNILSAGKKGGDHPHYVAAKDSSLPGPGGSPNSTHTQQMFIYFTHREEPPVALVALGLWNQTKVGPMPLDRRPDERVWQTSHVLPFLGHVAIERIGCDDGQDYVRTIVNGAVQRLEHCQSGPGHSCPLKQFAAFVDERVAQYADFEGACKV